MLALRTTQEARRDAIPLLRETLKQLIDSQVDFLSIFSKHKQLFIIVNLVQQDFETQAIPFLMRLNALMKSNIYRHESPDKVLLREEDLLSHLNLITNSLESGIKSEMLVYPSRQTIDRLFVGAERLSAEKRQLDARLSRVRAEGTASSAEDRPASPETTARNIARMRGIFNNMRAAFDNIERNLDELADIDDELEPNSDDTTSNP